MFSTFGALSNDVSPEKKDVHHIWGCPTMFRRKKKMFTTFGAWPNRCFAEKKTMFSTFGAWQNRCLVRGGLRGGGNLGRGKSLKTNIPY